jgi:hypothetical protein
MGAIAPDILILYSKRFTMPDTHFSAAMYLTATVLYMLLAVGVALIFPYGRKPRYWHAFALGVSLPIVVGALLSVGRANPIVPRGGASLIGSLDQLISLF